MIVTRTQSVPGAGQRIHVVSSQPLPQLLEATVLPVALPEVSVSEAVCLTYNKLNTYGEEQNEKG